MIGMFLCPSHMSIDIKDRGKGGVDLPSQPFHCEAGSGLIHPLAAAVWKTSDFVVFS